MTGNLKLKMIQQESFQVCFVFTSDDGAQRWERCECPGSSIVQVQWKLPVVMCAATRWSSRLFTLAARQIHQWYHQKKRFTLSTYRRIKPQLHRHQEELNMSCTVKLWIQMHTKLSGSTSWRANNLPLCLKLLFNKELHQTANAADALQKKGGKRYPLTESLFRPWLHSLLRAWLSATQTKSH